MEDLLSCITPALLCSINLFSRPCANSGSYGPQHTSSIPTWHVQLTCLSARGSTEDGNVTCQNICTRVPQSRQILECKPIADAQASAPCLLLVPSWVWPASQGSTVVMRTTLEHPRQDCRCAILTLMYQQGSLLPHLLCKESAHALDLHPAGLDIWILAWLIDQQIPKQKDDWPQEKPPGHHTQALQLLKGLVERSTFSGCRLCAEANPSGPSLNQIFCLPAWHF